MIVEKRPAKSHDGVLVEEESDVALQRSEHGVVCCACDLTVPRSYDQPEEYPGLLFLTKRDALAHLAKHVDAGHSVPREVFAMLEWVSWEER